MIFYRSLTSLLAEANLIRRLNFGNQVFLRIAHNYLPNQRCPADCSFCAWSCQAQLTEALRKQFINGYEKNVDFEACLQTAKEADKIGAHMEMVFNLEHMHSNLTANLIDVVQSVSQSVKIGIQPGLIADGGKYLAELTEAGLAWYCNDLETAPSYFPQICTTHTMRDKIESLQIAKKQGLAIWSGFCLGMGETQQQRLEAIETLKELDVQGVILNFFYDIPGIGLHGKIKSMTAEEILATIAIIRIMLPTKPIIVGGGRSTNLGEQKDRIYLAGATGIYLGRFLNHPTPQAEEDLQIIKEQGLEISPLPF